MSRWQLVKITREAVLNRATSQLVQLKMLPKFFNFIFYNLSCSSLSLPILISLRFIIALLGFAYVSTLFILVFLPFESNFASRNILDYGVDVSEAFSLKLCGKQVVPVQVNKDHSTKPGWLGDHNSAKVYLHAPCLSQF